MRFSHGLLHCITEEFHAIQCIHKLSAHSLHQIVLGARVFLWNAIRYSHDAGAGSNAIASLLHAEACRSLFASEIRLQASAATERHVGSGTIADVERESAAREVTAAALMDFYDTTGCQSTCAAGGQRCSGILAVLATMSTTKDRPKQAPWRYDE